jgi:hypothetical protein
MVYGSPRVNEGQLKVAKFARNSIAQKFSVRKQRRVKVQGQKSMMGLGDSYLQVVSGDS